MDDGKRPKLANENTSLTFWEICSDIRLCAKSYVRISLSSFLFAKQEATASGNIFQTVKLLLQEVRLVLSCVHI